MEEFERLAELETTMDHFCEGGEMDSLLIVTALAALGQENRAILVGGEADEEGFSPAGLEDKIAVFTALEEMEGSGLQAMPISIPDLLAFVACHVQEVKGLVINPAHQRREVSMDMVFDALDLMSPPDYAGQYVRPYDPADYPDAEDGDPPVAGSDRAASFEELFGELCVDDADETDGCEAPETV